MQRTGEFSRATKETDITVKINLDGTGEAALRYPLGFMTHMLDTFARHSLFDLDIRAKGDLEVDGHHLLEDTGIALGAALAKALGEKRGIRRAGFCLYPMDETLARASVDLSGRPFLVFHGELSGLPLGAGAGVFQTDTVEDFWQGFCAGGGITLHLDILRGRSDHHKVEALFKAAARAFRDAAAIDPRLPDLVPSTKGALV